VKGQISGIVLDGSTGLPLSGVKVEIAGKTATTDNAGYYVVSNVIPNDGDLTKGYSVSFYKNGYTAAQDANIQVDPNEYKNTDPFLEKQILLKLEDYFNTWLTQSYGNGTKIVTGTVNGSIQKVGDVGSNSVISAGATFWGTVNDAGDVVGGSIKGAAAAPIAGNFTATITGGNINLANIAISGSITSGAEIGEPIEVGTTALTITNLNITSAAGGNWTYAGGVYINEEEGTAVQVTSDPQNPEVPKFELKPLDYVYHYGQSLETVYLYPMNASISGKILTFHNNADVPVGVPNIKIEFSNVPSPVVGDALYTGPVTGTVNPGAVAITTATFIGAYNPGGAVPGAVSGTINGFLTGGDSFTGTVSGTAPATLTFNGKRSDGTDLVNGALNITVASLSPVGVSSGTQAGRFYGEGKTNAKGEFTVKGVPAGQALYIQIPGFTDKDGRYYSGSTLFSVTGTAWSPFSAGPWVSQRNATVALPTIYLKADSDIALVVESTLGTPQERLPIKGEGDEPTLLTVTFSKEIDIKTFSAKITTTAGAKVVGAGTDINLDVVKWEDTGTGSKAIKNSKVTLKADNKKIAGYYQSGLLPYWTGDAADLSVGNLSFGLTTRAADGSILVDPVTAAIPSLPVFTEIGLNLEKVEVIEASQSSRSILQQGGEIRLYFNKAVAQTEGTRFDLAGVQQAWKVLEDDAATADFDESSIVIVYNDRPVAAAVDLVTAGTLGVRSKADQLNDFYDILAGEISGLASWNSDMDFLSVLVNPYLDKTDSQGKLNAQRVGTNIKLGTVDEATKTDADNLNWDPLKNIVLEFNQALTPPLNVQIVYSPAPGVYRNVLALAAPAAPSAGNTVFTISPAVLLAPGQTYYLSFVADPAAPGVDPLKVDPQYTSYDGTNEVGPNIKITIEAESPARFTTLDAAKATIDDGFTVAWPAIEEYHADLTFDNWTFSAIPNTYNVERTVQLYIQRNSAWEAIGDPITIPAGYSAAAAIPAFEIQNYGAGNFPYQFRGIAANGQVLKYNANNGGNLPNATAPTAQYTPAGNIYTPLAITAYQGIPLATKYVGITIAPGPPTTTFKAIDEDEDVSDWFTNLPEGLVATTAYAVAAGDSTVTIKLTGTPTGELITSPVALKAVVPGSFVKFGVNLEVGVANNITIRVDAPVVDIAGLYNKGARDNTPPYQVNYIIGSSTPLAGNDVTLVLNLLGDNKFAQPILITDELTSWFINLPKGLTVYPLTPVSVGENMIEVAFLGTPENTAVSNQSIQVKIPGDVTLASDPIYVNTVTDYQFQYNVTSLQPGTATIGVAVGDTGGPIINGPVGLPLAASRYFTITVSNNNDAFLDIPQDTDVTGWFNLAEYGLSAAIANQVKAGDPTATIKVTGTPSKIVPAAPVQPLTYVIPANRLRNNLSIKGGGTAINYQFGVPTATASAVVASGVLTSPATPIAPVTTTITLPLIETNVFNPAALPSAAQPYALTITDWISNPPAGLSLSTRGVTGYTNTLVLIISGAPTEASSQWIEFKVPASANKSGQLIHIPPVYGNRFSIRDLTTIVTASVSGANIGPIVKGIPLANPVDYTITLVNDKFNVITAGSTTAFTFPDLPTGLTASVLYQVYAGETEAVVRINGTPNPVNTGVSNIRVTIPATSLQNGEAVVASVPGYVYDIIQPTAIVDNGTVSGTAGTAITAVDFTITLQGGNYFLNAYTGGVSNLIGWIANTVPGLSYTVKTTTTANATSLVLTIAGLPTAASTERIRIVIPGTEVRSGADIPIATSATRVYSIAP
jgi:hypothetical protein